jgi:hypothetical protein
MSACLQRSQRRSQCANLPSPHEPGCGATERAWVALDGTVGRRSAPAGSACSPGKAARRRGSSGPPASGARGQHPRQGHGCQGWRDRHLRFHFYDQLEPSPDIGDLRRRSTATRSRSSGDSPSRLRRPQSRCLTVRLPIGAARHPVSLGYDSSGIPRTAPDHPRNPAAVTSPKWLWLTCL